MDTIQLSRDIINYVFSAALVALFIGLVHFERLYLRKLERERITKRITGGR